MYAILAWLGLDQIFSAVDIAIVEYSISTSLVLIDIDLYGANSISILIF